MSVPSSGQKHPTDKPDDKEWMKSYGEGEIGAMKQSREEAKKEGERPMAASTGASHVEEENYRTPKEKMAAAIKDYTDESGPNKPHKHG